MTSSPGSVGVRALQRTDGSIYLEVGVRSQIRPVIRKWGIVEHGEHSPQLERQKVGVLAGALAELLCRDLRDTLEPSGAARAALEAYDEMVAETSILQRGNELPRAADRHHP
jgi:hypothetical protein